MWFRVVAVAFCLSTFELCQCNKTTGQSAGNPGQNQTDTPKAQVGEDRRISTVLDTPWTERNSTLADNEDEEEFTENPDDDESEEHRKFFSKSDEESKVCYKTLGCFMLGDPWKSVLRPISAPMSPKKIAAHLRFFNRKDIKKGVKITLYPKLNMRGARFDPKKMTVFMVHGFATSGESEWLNDLKDVYLKRVDANVMLVDWGKGAQLFNYLQVAGNTRLIGRQLEQFVNMLIFVYGADPGKIHLIGHSLGAHICAYLAKAVKGISRLTALDPAQPGFEGFSEEVRLAETDAEFIDVIHTSAKPFIPTFGLGMIKPVGHVDFYVNGGFSQPGCLVPDLSDVSQITRIHDLAKIPVEILANIVKCPHGRSFEYLIEALNDTERCTFWGHKANPVTVISSATNMVTQGFLKNLLKLSDGCTVDTCVPLGLDTNLSPLRGVFLVTTAAKKPFCLPESNTTQENDDEKQDSIFKSMAKKITSPLRL